MQNDRRDTEFPQASANPGYALDELARALAAQNGAADERARANADHRVEAWRRVLTGMTSGALEIGAREPVQNVPAWATLEVAHGGFATGGLLAGGPLLAHERALLAHVASAPAPGVGERALLNVFYLSDEGRRRLDEMRANGTFRVNVPEEGALLVVSFLLARGDNARAESILEAIAPFMDRLRFYPVPDPRPLLSTSVVSVAKVADVRTALSRRRPKPAIVRMNDALTLWLPLYDRVASLFLMTVKGPAPTFVRGADGALLLRPDRQPLLQGGLPCQRFPEGFADEARATCALYTELRQRHASAHGAPHGASEPISPNMATLLAYAATAARDPKALGERDVARIRRALAGFCTKHGAPGSWKHAHLRARQAAWAKRPLHADLAHVLGDRLARRPQDAGLSSLEGLNDDAAIPPHLMSKLTRCIEGTIDELVRRRIVTSGEVLALVLPQVTSQIRALGIGDPELSRVYAAIYGAFRKRRSLLLLDLGSQVKLAELPWVQAIERFRDGSVGEAAAARTTLEQVATLHVTAFPETIFPNKLVTELVALAKGAGLVLPLTEELAADIFMGAFTPKFVAAARVAAELLTGSPYERYYGIPYDRVRSLGDGGEKPELELARLCVELSRQRDLPRFGTPAQNGRIIEQQQIVTTHDLAQLFSALGLHNALRGELRHLAERAFHHAAKLLGTKHGGKTGLRARKDAAYAFRQMLFFLSFVSEDELFAFSIWAEETVSAQPEDASARLGPFWRGVSHVLADGAFDDDGRGPGDAVRFLGWTTIAARDS